MRTVVRVLAGLAVALAASGCWIARVEGPPADDLSTWSEVPLAPDPELARVAASGESSCITGRQGDRVQVLLQDRRTASTAAFLFTGPGAFGSCFVTKAGGGAGGGSGPLPEPMTSDLSLDANGFGDVADGEARHLGGRVGDDVTRVDVALADGRSVTASVANGYWLAWWPDDVLAEQVLAVDASGAVLETVEVPR